MSHTVLLIAAEKIKFVHREQGRNKELQVRYKEFRFGLNMDMSHDDSQGMAHLGRRIICHRDHLV